MASPAILLSIPLAFAIILAVLSVRAAVGNLRLSGLTGLPLRDWPWRFWIPFSRQAQVERNNFMRPFLGVLIRVAQADGRVSESETGLIETMLRQEFRLRDEAVGTALRGLSGARLLAKDFSALARELALWAAEDRGLLDNVLFFMFAVACADGSLTAEEGELIDKACEIFQIDSAGRADIESYYREWIHAAREEGLRTQETQQEESAADADPRHEKPEDEPITSETRQREHWLRVLTLPSNSTLQDVKIAYRKLAKKYHPDALAARGAPREYLTYSAGRFREIQAAYESLIRDEW